MQIIDIRSKEFEPYGKAIEMSQISASSREELIGYFMEETEAPRDGNIYVADVEAIHHMTAAKEIGAVLEYDEPQFGYCHGNSTKVNALEWHKCQELVLAVTEVVLYLGRPDLLSNVEGKKTFYTDNLITVKMCKGDIVCLNPEVLHFAPTKITKEPYRTMIVLDKGTNAPLNGTRDGHLFMRNKWLIAHRDRQDLVAKGAYPGVVGENFDWNDLINGGQV